MRKTFLFGSPKGTVEKVGFVVEKLVGAKRRSRFAGLFGFLEI
jgi:hypothetical protein